MRSKDDALKWFPLWVDKWLFGSTRIELQPDERAVWTDFMALAAKDNGWVRANSDTPYPPEQLAGLLCISRELLDRSIKRFLETEKIKIEEDAAGYQLINWIEYSLSDNYKRQILAKGYGYWKDSQKMGIHSQKTPTREEKRREEKSIKETTKPLRETKTSRPGNPYIKEFIDFYFQEFKGRFGIEPIIEDGKDGALIKRLLQKIDFNQLKILLMDFLDSDDPFIQKSGYTIGAFKSVIQKLRIKPPPGGKSFRAANLWLRKEEARDAEQAGQKKISHGPNENESNPSGDKSQ